MYICLEIGIYENMHFSFAAPKRIETVTLDDDEEKNTTNGEQTEKAPGNEHVSQQQHEQVPSNNHDTASTPHEPPVVDISADEAATTLPPAPLKLGIVQTAYANGASTAYLKEQLQV